VCLYAGAYSPYVPCVRAPVCLYAGAYSPYVPCVRAPVCLCAGACANTLQGQQYILGVCK